MHQFLLDTCTAIWIADGRPIREPGASAMERSPEAGAQALVSPITAWEVAILVAKGRIALAMSPEIWFDRLCGLPGMTLAEMPPSVLIASCALPGSPPADPADRILAATARAFGYTLVTRDRRLLDYGAEGHVRVLGC